MITPKLFAQTTSNGIFFQAIARDNFSNPAKDRKIYVQSSIIQTTATGTKVLTEEYQTTTDVTARQLRLQQVGIIKMNGSI